MEKEKEEKNGVPPPGAWKMQICKVLDSFSPKCSSARNVEHCSQASGYPQKIFSDNLTNIDTNPKKMLEFSGVGPWPLKLQFFVTPVLSHFRMKHPKMTVTKPIMETRDHNLYQNTPYTILQPYTKPYARSSIQISRTTHHTTHQTS